MKKMYLLLGIFALISYAGAAVVFEDPFDTKDNWARAYGTSDETLMNSKFIVENTDPQYWCFYKHDADYAKFTYSVTINALTDHSALGMTFCWQSSSFEGYILALWNTDTVSQYYSLLKIVRQGQSSITSPLLTGWNSFINKRDNELKVSKNGSRIDIFCNGVWIDSTSDASFASGGVGLVLGVGEKAAFDHAIVADTYETGVPPEYFIDNFDNNSMSGWRVYFDGAGTVEETGGVLKISAGTNARNTMVITNGTYRSVPIRATVTRESGDGDAMYGLMFLKTVFDKSTNPPLNLYDAFVFKVNADQNYAAYYLSTSDSVKYSVFPPHTSINGTTDTLLVTPGYKFVVNGDTLPDIDFDTLNFDFNAVGFIVDSNVTVSFDNFAAGDSSKPITAAAWPKRWMPTIIHGPTYELGGPGIIYDIRGRIVARYTGNYRDSLRELGAGNFFIVPNNSKAFKVQRAIINTK